MRNALSDRNLNMTYFHYLKAISWHHPCLHATIIKIIPFNCESGTKNPCENHQQIAQRWNNPEIKIWDVRPGCNRGKPQPQMEDWLYATQMRQVHNVSFLFFSSLKWSFVQAVTCFVICTVYVVVEGHEKRVVGLKFRVVDRMKPR